MWKNHDFELLITPAGDGARYRAMFGMTTFGWAKYQCHFTTEFAASEKGPCCLGRADLDEDSASTLFMARSGAMLTLTEDFPDNAGDANRPRICPHGADFRDPLFHTGLKPTQAYRLKPDD